MKKSISVFLCLALILSSFSFAFASPTVWDTSDQQNLLYIRNSVTGNGTMITALNSIITNTNTIANHLNTIKGYLVDSGHGVAYWVQAIDTWMSPIYNSINAIPVDLSTIIGALGYFDSNNTFHPYLIQLENISKANTAYRIAQSGFSVTNAREQAHQQLFNSVSSFSYNVDQIAANGGFAGNTFYWGLGTPLGNVALLLQYINSNIAKSYQYRWTADLTGYNSQQALVSFADPYSTFTFTPQSATDGIYKYLNAINTPLARLGYVLASDSRIEAQEFAADNEQAVVDNFINPDGSGSASTSDIDSIADFSSGYKSTFASDASPTGIFNLFTSDNMSWFSQETYNQLDTTSNNRAKSDNTFNTPLLDQQINSIYEQLGVKQP